MTKYAKIMKKPAPQVTLSLLAFSGSKKNNSSRWLKENHEALLEYNSRIEERSVFSENHRPF